MVARQHNNVVISDIDKKTLEPKMFLCARFCCSTFDHVEGVGRQRNKHTDRRKEIYCNDSREWFCQCTIFRLRFYIPLKLKLQISPHLFRWGLVYPEITMQKVSPEAFRRTGGAFCCHSFGPVPLLEDRCNANKYKVALSNPVRKHKTCDKTFP